MLEAATSAPRPKTPLHGSSRLTHVAPESAVNDSCHSGTAAGPVCVLESKYARVFVMRANSMPRSPYPPGRPPVRAGACSVLHVLPSSTDCSMPTAQKDVAAVAAPVSGHSLVRAHTLVPMALTCTSVVPMG